MENFGRVGRVWVLEVGRLGFNFIFVVYVCLGYFILLNLVSGDYNLYFL